MSKPIVKVACGLLVMLVAIGSLAGCGGKLPEPGYADQMTEEAMWALNDGDYTGFLQYFSPDSRSALDEENFNTQRQNIKVAFGDYISKEYWRTTTQDSYTVVEYTADFSGTSEEIIISVYFEEIDGEIYIAGFWVRAPSSGG